MRWRHIVRHLAATPAFTGMAVLTLALGIGANTAIFSVISGVLLKPLPYPGSETLVALDHSAPGLDIKRAGTAPFLYYTYREDAKVFQDVAMWQTGTVSVTGIAKPEEVRTLFATDGLLPILGVQPQLGRIFTRADDSPAGAETVVLMPGYWRRTFGGDPSVIGRTITLDGRPREVIGVLPDTFRFLDQDVVAGAAAAARSQQGGDRPVQLPGHRAAQAGRDPGARVRRRDAADPDRAPQVPALSRLPRWRSSSRPASRPKSARSGTISSATCATRSGC